MNIGGSESEGTLSLFIRDSQILSIIETDEETKNIQYLKGLVEEYAYIIVDVLVYTSGVSYDVEVTSAITPSNEITFFGAERPALQQHIEREGVYLEERLGNIWGLYSESTNRHLRRALSDLRKASNYPLDSPFYCYRAVESLRHYFGDEDTDKKEEWERMRAKLGVEKEDIMTIKEFADPRRHGDKIEITEEKRVEILQTTWSMIDSYVDFVISRER